MKIIKILLLLIITITLNTDTFKFECGDSTKEEFEVEMRKLAEEPVFPIELIAIRIAYEDCYENN